MNAYRIFILAFVLSIVAFVVVMISYVNGIMDVVRIAQHGNEEMASEILKTIFSPLFIISCLVLGICSLLYRVLGIVFVVKSNAEGGEKALWIIGFILIGFITAIIFMAVAKSRNLLIEGQNVAVSD